MQKLSEINNVTNLADFFSTDIVSSKHSLPQTALSVIQMLESQAEDFTRKISNLKSSVSILKREIYYIENDLEAFLLLYYERFSEIAFGKLSEVKPEDDEGVSPSEQVENISLMGFKRRAVESELKKTYHYIVKKIHPDVLDSAFGKVLMRHVNRIYEEANLDELMFIKVKLDRSEVKEDNVMRLVELLEDEHKILTLKLKRYEAKRDSIIKSPEYKLYTKYKIMELRGEDFFKLIRNSLG